MFMLGSGSFPTRKWWQWLLLMALTAVAGYALMVAICAPSAYAESAYPENRVLMIGRFISVATTIVLGGLAGLALRAWLERLVRLEPALFNAAALAILGLGCLYAVVISYQINSKDIPYRQAWAAAWDKRDVQIQAAAARGDASITVTALDSLESLYELGPDPHHWVNGCAASYYGLQQIIANPP
jgi:MFS family permease